MLQSHTEWFRWKEKPTSEGTGDSKTSVEASSPGTSIPGSGASWECCTLWQQQLCAVGLWKTSTRGPGIRGVPTWPIDCLGVVGQQDKPPVQLGGTDPALSSWGRWTPSLLPELPALEVRQGRRKGQGLLTETVLPSPNIWCQCSPKIDHFLLPPRRKQCWKESQIQQGWCKEGSRSLAASHREPLPHPGVWLWDHTSVSGRFQGISPAKRPDDPRGCRASQLPGAETHQHFPSVAGIAKPAPLYPKAAPVPRGSGCDLPSPAFSSSIFTLQSCFTASSLLAGVRRNVCQQIWSERKLCYSQVWL